MAKEIGKEVKKGILGGWTTYYGFMTPHTVEVPTIDIDHVEVKEPNYQSNPLRLNGHIHGAEFLGHDLEHK